MWRLQKMVCADSVAPIPAKFRAIEHDLLDFERASTLYVAGPRNSTHVVFFIGGWPDDHRTFLPLAARLADSGCLVGVGCMPDFDRIAQGKTPLRKWGFNFDEMGECCAQAVAALRAQAALGSDSRSRLCLRALPVAH